MILKPGEKIHVIQRQFFEDDVRRHFVGIVESCDGVLARVTGHLFAMDHKLNQFVRRDQIRTQIIPLSTGTNIINVLPEQVNIDKVFYKFNKVDDIIVTDGSGWHFDLSHL